MTEFRATIKAGAKGEAVTMGGAAVTRTVVDAGATVTVLGPNRAKLESQDLDHVVCDVTDPTAVHHALESARRRNGPIHVAVAHTGMDRDRVADRLRTVNPQGRFIDADEVAAAVRRLCSDSARSVNGHALALAGGEL